MLAARYRLPATQKLTRATYKRTSYFSVKYVQSGMSESRFAFVVPKRVDKSAVIRNRIRRVFRSCIEKHLYEFVPGYDMLFFPEKCIIDKSYTEICRQLHTFLDQEKLLLKKTS